ncbi:MAG: hypothetical protein KatS3mg131_3373 [Candidatus Tectimicrobiota bacterium]|nr:MAG: hypothetical protein KatS3mg131_3373 [Candidatus Tectomicrobia bacterium]
MTESDIDLLIIREHFPRSRLDRHWEVLEVAKVVLKEFTAQAPIIPLTPAEAQVTKSFYLPEK